MAIIKKRLVSLFLSFFLVAVSSVTTFYVAKKISSPLTVTPVAPASKPRAENQNMCPAREACPDSDNILQNCTPPDGDGSPVASICNGAGRIEPCGGQQYCCPGANMAWTTDMSACCTDTTWTPNPSLTCTGTNLTQTSNCGNTRVVGGTKTDGTCVACTDTTWTPNPSLTCTGTNLTQTSNCGTTRSVAGTKYCCTDTTWTPATNTVCTGTNVTQTSNCGATRSVAGTKYCCTDTTWTPNPSLTCTGTNVTQTSNCGATRSVAGTKYCCTDTTWTPNPSLTCTGTNVTQTSNCGTTRVVEGTKVDTTWTPTPANTCSDKKVTQTGNCGGEREVDGTKTCLPNLSIAKKVYQDDSRNKPGVYYADKQISKVSRDQFVVYTMEVKNFGEGSAKNFKITDTLTGQNQSLLAFVDGEDKCKFDFPSKRITCEIAELISKAEVNLKFRVKVAQTALNGKVIRNTSKVTYNNKTKESSVDVLISSIVSCNEYCTNDSECLAGLACDVFSNKCRKPTCLQSTSCNCVSPVAVATVTKKPTTTVALTTTISPTTTTAIDFPDSLQLSPTAEITPIALAEELPQTGIFDLPQTAIFGGGLILAILGLFLAL